MKQQTKHPEGYYSIEQHIEQINGNNIYTGFSEVYSLAVWKFWAARYCITSAKPKAV